MIALLLALAAQTAAPAAPAAPPPDLSWLGGYWLSCEGAREVSETWSGPRAGTLVGGSLTTEANGQVSHELSRIGPSRAGLSFFAQPSGQPAAEFPLKSAASGRAVFENPAHDFPQRIIYARRGDRLTARIEGVMDGRTTAMEWRYTAAPLNRRCPARR